MEYFAQVHFTRIVQGGVADTTEDDLSIETWQGL